MSDFQFDVRINGQSIASPLAPILEDIQVFDGTDSEADTASITVADIDGSVAMADERDEVEIDLGTVDGVGLVFQGFVSDIRSRGGRSKGRTLTLECSSVDPGGKAKEEGEQHWDDKPLGAILEEAFKSTGLPILVSPSFASVIRDYEAMDAETPLAFARRLADELGATFKAMGKRFVFTERNAALDVLGGALPVFSAAWGDNLIDWDLTPIIPKARFANTRSRWFDFTKSEWNDESQDLSAGEAKQLVAALKPGSGIAKQSAVASKVRNQREGGEGSITVRGSYRPQADGKCQVTGARDGIDGLYVISSVQHTANKSRGFITKLELKKPEGSAGKDSRVPIPSPAPR